MFSIIKLGKFRKKRTKSDKEASSNSEAESTGTLTEGFSGEDVPADENVEDMTRGQSSFAIGGPITLDKVEEVQNAQIEEESEVFVRQDSAVTARVFDPSLFAQDYPQQSIDDVFGTVPVPPATSILHQQQDFSPPSGTSRIVCIFA